MAVNCCPAAAVYCHSFSETYIWSIYVVMSAFLDVFGSWVSMIDFSQFLWINTRRMGFAFSRNGIKVVNNLPNYLHMRGWRKSETEAIARLSDLMRWNVNILLTKDENICLGDLAGHSFISLNWWISVLVKDLFILHFFKVYWIILHRLNHQLVSLFIKCFLFIRTLVMRHLVEKLPSTIYSPSLTLKKLRQIP